MPANYHAIVWIDHREARIFHFSLAVVDRIVIHPHRPESGASNTKRARSAATGFWMKIFSNGSPR